MKNLMMKIEEAVKKIIEKIRGDDEDYEEEKYFFHIDLPFIDFYIEWYYRKKKKK